MERYTLLNAKDLITLDLKEKVIIEHKEYFIDSIDVEINMHQIKPAKVVYISTRNYNSNQNLPDLLEEYEDEG
jgi:hypothetical protein